MSGTRPLAICDVDELTAFQAAAVPRRDAVRVGNAARVGELAADVDRARHRRQRRGDEVQRVAPGRACVSEVVPAAGARGRRRRHEDGDDRGGARQRAEECGPAHQGRSFRPGRGRRTAGGPGFSPLQPTLRLTAVGVHRRRSAGSDLAAVRDGVGGIAPWIPLFLTDRKFSSRSPWPSWNTSTRTPWAAPTDSRSRTLAFSGTTIARKVLSRWCARYGGRQRVRATRTRMPRRRMKGGSPMEPDRTAP